MSLEKLIKLRRNMNEIHFDTVNKVLSDIKRSGNVQLLSCNTSVVDQSLLECMRLRPMYVVSIALERTYAKTNSTV